MRRSSRESPLPQPGPGDICGKVYGFGAPTSKRPQRRGRWWEGLVGGQLMRGFAACGFASGCKAASGNPAQPLRSADAGDLLEVQHQRRHGVLREVDPERTVLVAGVEAAHQARSIPVSEVL